LEAQFNKTRFSNATLAAWWQASIIVAKDFEKKKTEKPRI
jgi:hypothetical protein